LKESVMADETADQPVLKHIEELVAEEDRLYEQGDLSDKDREKLRRIKIELDQFWDLLRQRRALREYGRNPDEADLRPPGVVEKYEG
jgi:hypothetical protein